MIYLIHGDDTEKVVKKKDELLKILKEKRPDASFFRLESPFLPVALDEYIASRGMFEEKHIVHIEGLVDKENVTFVLERLPEMAGSSHVFLLTEASDLGKDLALFEPHAAKVFSFKKKEDKSKEEVKKKTVFSLGDAFGQKDRKTAWVLLQKLFRMDAAAEEIHGTLFWQVKTMLLTKKIKSAVEAGVSPYAWTKATRLAKNFTEEELKNISSELVKMYHGTRSEGGGTLEIELEKFLLGK